MQYQARMCPGSNPSSPPHQQKLFPTLNLRAQSSLQGGSMGRLLQSPVVNGHSPWRGFRTVGTQLMKQLEEWPQATV